MPPAFGCWSSRHCGGERERERRASASERSEGPRGRSARENSPRSTRRRATRWAARTRASGAGRRRRRRSRSAPPSCARARRAPRRPRQARRPPRSERAQTRRAVAARGHDEDERGAHRARARAVAAEQRRVARGGLHRLLRRRRRAAEPSARAALSGPRGSRLGTPVVASGAETSRKAVESSSSATASARARRTRRPACPSATTRGASWRSQSFRGRGGARGPPRAFEPRITACLRSFSWILLSYAAAWLSTFGPPLSAGANEDMDARNLARAPTFVGQGAKVWRGLQTPAAWPEQAPTPFQSGQMMYGALPRSRPAPPRSRARRALEPGRSEARRPRSWCALWPRADE